jgi:hypothetical protein
VLSQIAQQMLLASVLEKQKRASSISRIDIKEFKNHLLHVHHGA